LETSLAEKGSAWPAEGARPSSWTGGMVAELEEDSRSPRSRSLSLFLCFSFFFFLAFLVADASESPIVTSTVSTVASDGVERTSTDDESSTFTCHQQSRVISRRKKKQ